MDHSPYDLFVTIRGHAQGQFNGGITEKGHEHTIGALAFRYDVTQPTQTQTGQATGKVEHSPVTIVKEWDTASAQIYTAIINQENLDTVLFAFAPRQGPTGAPSGVYHTITLKNAIVSKVSLHRDSPSPGAVGDPRDLEEVSFLFQEIEFSNPQGGVAPGVPATPPPATLAPAPTLSRVLRDLEVAPVGLAARRGSST